MVSPGVQGHGVQDGADGRCGGGGGGSGPAAISADTPPVSAAPPEDTTGVVGILIKDGPTDDFLRIMITITGVELLGDDGAYVIF